MQIKLEKQKNFEDVIKKQLEIIDPLQISEYNEILDLNNYMNIVKNLDTYIFNINTFEYKLILYYNSKNIQKCINLSMYTEKLNKFNIRMNEFNTRINQIILEVNKLNIEKIKIDIEKSKRIVVNEERMKEDEVNHANNTKILLGYQEIYISLKKEIKAYRNSIWEDIVNSAKLVIEEREKIIVNEIE